MSNIKDLDKNYRKTELPEDLSGFKAILTVDIYNKRKVKKSIPTYILNIIEKNSDGITLKDIENKLVSSKDAFIKGKKSDIEKTGKDFRDFIKGRIIAVKRYYLASDIIKEFDNNFLLISDKTDGKEKLFLSYKLIPNTTE